MRREDVKNLLPILQAYADGKIIQWKNGSGVWENTSNQEDLCFISQADYRVRPEPREFWIAKPSWLVYLKEPDPDVRPDGVIHVREVID